MRLLKSSLVGMFLLTSLPFASAQSTYEQILDRSEILGSGGSRAAYGVVIEGTTSYNFLSLEDTSSSSPADAGRITVTSNIGGTTNTTELLSTATWEMATGLTNIAGFYGYGISGDFLQFAETGTDSIWRVDKNTGSLSEYVSAATIFNFTGEASAQILSPHTVAPSGEHAFYEGRSDSILVTSGASSVSTLVSSSQLTALTGNDTVSGGITFDASGNLIWGSNTSDSIYSWDGAMGIELLSTAELISITGESAAGFGDIFFAPDNLVYFYDTTSDGILSFDPLDAANTLQFVLTEDELISGPEGSDSVSGFTWFDDSIAWSPVSPTATLGLFGSVTAIPEPSSMAFCMALVGTVMTRRRKR